MTDEIRSVMAVESVEEFDLFRLYWEEEHGIDPDDPPEGFVEWVSSLSRSEVEEMLEELRVWKRRESERWFWYETDIPEMETASPWKYLEAFAERYDNVAVVDYNRLRFVGDQQGPVVKEELAHQMLLRGAVIAEVVGSEVVFTLLHFGDTTHPEWFERLE